MFDCPTCHQGLTTVVNSRPNAAGIRRRRFCEVCKQKFSTQEVALAKRTRFEGQGPFEIVKAKVPR